MVHGAQRQARHDQYLVHDGLELFGWRKTDPSTGKPGAYEWVTLNDFLPVVEAAASGMSHVLKLPRGAIVGVFAKNSYQWSIVEHSASRMAYTLVPLYDTLGATAIPFILNHTEMNTVFCGKEQFKLLMGVVHECPTVKTVVQFEDAIDEEETLLAAQHRVKLLTLSQLIEDGKKNVVPADPPLPSDLATICYTSGTTGNPKGAMLTHANMMAAATCALQFTLVVPTDVHLSYLPLAHCFERVIQTTCIFSGAAVGYYSGDVKLLMADLAELQPTIFPSVPRLLNRIHDKISQGVEHAGGLKKWLFDTAYAAKKFYLKDGYKTHAFWDFVVFSKAQQALGGRPPFVDSTTCSRRHSPTRQLAETLAPHQLLHELGPLGQAGSDAVGQDPRPGEGGRHRLGLAGHRHDPRLETPERQERHADVRDDGRVAVQQGEHGAHVRQRRRRPPVRVLHGAGRCDRPRRRQHHAGRAAHQQLRGLPRRHEEDLRQTVRERRCRGFPFLHDPAPVRAQSGRQGGQARLAALQRGRRLQRKLDHTACLHKAGRPGRQFDAPLVRPSPFKVSTAPVLDERTHEHGWKRTEWAQAQALHGFFRVSSLQRPVRGAARARMEKSNERRHWEL